MKKQPQEQLQEVEMDLGPEVMLKQIREEMARLREHEMALIQAIDAKAAEDEARRPKESLSQQFLYAAKKSFEDKLKKATNGKDPRSDLDKYYANRGRAR